MAEEARDERTTIPAAIKRVVIAVVRHLRRASRRRALARCLCSATRTASYVTRLGLSEEEGGFAGDPILGRGQADRPRGVPGRRRDLRRAAGRDDPLHRHQRGDHRRVAARVLHGPAPPGARPPAPAAPEVRDAVDRHHASSGPSPALAHDPRAGRLPGQHVRVRGDAVVHDRPPRGHPPALQPRGRGAALPRAGQRALPRPRPAAVRRLRRPGHGPGLRRRHRAAPRRRRGRRRLAGARAA